ncbi:helix-turn-helix domain-containing protein, partial [Stieleria sp.]|uniref:helix-turn-helix domain-containing protein n=1 Tax=Stieleria sp. TaxID=2795976 RepID=UPI003565B36A
TALPQPALPQPALPQPALPQPALPQPALPQPALPQPALPQAALPQAALAVPPDRLSEGIPPLPDVPPTPETAETAYTLVGKTLQEIERDAIIQTLRSVGGNKAKTARTLGISEKSIYNKMRRLQIPF